MVGCLGLMAFMGWLFGSYGVGYLTPNSVYMYIHSN